MLEELDAQFAEECEGIAEECQEEGYPGHGSNYDIRVESLAEGYYEQYGYNPLTGEFSM